MHEETSQNASANRLLDAVQRLVGRDQQARLRKVGVRFRPRPTPVSLSVGRAHGASIVSSKLFPSMLT
jgi:hypothetical protein